MIKRLRVSSGIIVVLLGLYIIITGYFSLMPINLIFLSILLFISGMEELIRRRRVLAYTFFVGTALNLYVSVQLLAV